MHRDLESELIRWKNAKEHAPLLLRGARQVGKSYLATSFGQRHFDHVLVINFEKEEKYKLVFETLDPPTIINRLYLQSGQKIVPGKSLLFLDEIQECTQALKALRYFKEELPEQHLIAAGSLLEFALNNETVRMPVGRVESLFLKPLSFYEYLTALNLGHLRDYLQQATLATGIEPLVHEALRDFTLPAMWIAPASTPAPTTSEALASANAELRTTSASLAGIASDAGVSWASGDNATPAGRAPLALMRAPENMICGAPSMESWPGRAVADSSSATGGTVFSSVRRSV